MDRRVLAHYGGDVTRANILPRRRAKLLARYGATPERPAPVAVGGSAG
jgi:alkane 1-monooxygenase